MSSGILITRFSSSEIRTGSLSVQVKFTHFVGGVVFDAPVACVLSKVSSTLGLGLVVSVSPCGTFGTAPGLVECASPGVLAGVTSVKATPTSCGSAPALDYDSPVSGDDDASAVVDNVCSSRRLLS